MILQRGDLMLEFFAHPGLDPLASWFSCCLRLDDLAEFYRQCKSVGIQETSSGYPRIHAPELQEWGGTMAALVEQACMPAGPTRGWMAFPIMILLASGGIGMPALQAMLSRQVDDDHQGQLQGSLAALTSLTSIIGPLIVTAIYAASASTWNGLAWIVGAALYLVCLPALRRGAWSRATST